MNKISIIGIRGVPASHGGFETFAHHLALYLIDKGWSVSVYCQEVGDGSIYESEWEGVNRIHIPVKGDGPVSTIKFDWLSHVHCAKQDGLILSLGYNTALFACLFRVAGKRNVINMDGIEWKRDKWGKFAKLWFWVNERFGSILGNSLVADHPKIKEHLATRVSENKITMIPYGANEVLSETVDASFLDAYKISPKEYVIVVARAEPENSLLEIVTAFSTKKRNCKLVVLGKYEASNEYHARVKECASDEVLFVGTVYDQKELSTLRYYSKLYIHGHTVGGTNPSLVEALGAGNALLCHDNLYNRWVAGDASVYFEDVNQASKSLDLLLNDDDELEKMSFNAKERFTENFTWEKVLKQYEDFLLSENLKIKNK